MMDDRIGLNKANTSLENILLRSSGGGKALNWRRLWTPHSQKQQIKESQDNLPQSNSITRSVQIPAFASKFYEELEQKYFKTSDKKTRGKQEHIVKFAEELSLVNSEDDIPNVVHNIEDNAILNAYKDVVKSMRSTRSKKLETIVKEEELDDSACNVSQGKSDNVLIYNEQRVGEVYPTTNIIEEKMNKYEKEIKELKTILAKTFDYITRMKDEISVPIAKRATGINSAVVQTSMNKELESDNELNISNEQDFDPHSPSSCTLNAESKHEDDKQYKLLKRLKNEVELLKSEIKSSRPPISSLQRNKEHNNDTSIAPRQYIEQLNEKLARQIEGNMKIMEELHKEHKEKVNH